MARKLQFARRSAVTLGAVETMYLYKRMQEERHVLKHPLIHLHMHWHGPKPLLVLHLANKMH